MLKSTLILLWLKLKRRFNKGLTVTNQKALLKIDYDKVVEYATLDDRLGKSHWNVPGPDGDFGFGGHCLPKDLSALIYLAMNLDTETNVLNAVEETNDVVRKNRDWEKMKGRAVV